MSLPWGFVSFPILIVIVILILLLIHSPFYFVNTQLFVRFGERLRNSKITITIRSTIKNCRPRTLTRRQKAGLFRNARDPGNRRIREHIFFVQAPRGKL